MRRIKYIVGLVSFVLIIVSCSKKTVVYSVIDSLATLDSLGVENKELKVEYNGANKIENYIPDLDRPLLHKQKIIKAVVHIMYDSLGQNNFEPEEAKKFMYYLISDANKKLATNKKMHLPIGNDTEVLPLGYKYKIVPGTDEPGDDGYYFHNDNELYWFVNKGKNRNNYDRKVIKKYNIGGDSLLNIFVLPHHPDSIRSKTYKAHGTGIALGNSLKMAGFYANKDKGHWHFSTLLNHEVGHVLGLRHSWVGNDGCDDTPKNPNCWDDNQCKEAKASNNMMDYNNSQASVTPCQIGTMHKNMTKFTARQRKFLEQTWCELDTTADIIISGETHWKGEKDLSNHIYIEETGVLRLSSRLSMAKDSEIYIEPGGKLILDNCHLHNSWGNEWLGITCTTVGDKAASVEYLGKVKIENVKGAATFVPKAIDSGKFIKQD